MYKSALLRMLAAASEAKKKALGNKYKVSEHFVNLCAEADPTPNGQYTEWLVKCLKPDYGDNYEGISQEIFLRDFEEVTDALVEFGRLKNSNEWKQTHNTDILSYPDVDEFVKIIRESSPEDYSKKERLRDLQRRRNQYLEEGCDFLGNPREGMACFQPTTTHAVQLMGEGSHWCTKGAYAQSYLNRGNLYVFVTDDKESSYGSDRYAQVFVPEESAERFEMQNVEGHNLGHTGSSDKTYRVDDHAWWMIDFLTQHDRTLRAYVDSGWVFNESHNEEAIFEQCAECGEAIDEGDDSIFITDDEALDNESNHFCCKRCFDSYYSDQIDEQVEHFMTDRGIYDEADVKIAEEEVEKLIRGNGDNPQANKVFKAMTEASIRMNLTNTVNHHYDANWFLMNLKSGLRPTVSSETVEKITPGITKEDYQVALDALQPLLGRAGGLETEIEKATQYVKENFDPNDMDIEAILEEGGYIKAKVKQSSFSIEAAASEAKKKALAAKYNLPASGVEILANTDPTPNGQFTEWLCRETRKAMDDPNGRAGLVGTLHRDEIKAMIEHFIRLKNSANFTGSKDIMTYDLARLKETVDSATRSDLSKNEQKKELVRQKDKYLRAGCEPLLHKNGYGFYRLTTPEALSLMSKGSHWCTQGETTANAYLQGGPLYMVIKDDGRNETYGSDRFALVRIPHKSDRGVECQDVDGRNLGDITFIRRDGGTVKMSERAHYNVDPDYFWIFETLAEFDEVIKKDIEDEVIFAGDWDISNDDDLYDEEEIVDDEDDGAECSECGDWVSEDDGYVVNGAIFCGSHCVRDHYADAVRRIIVTLVPEKEVDDAFRAVQRRMNYDDYEDLEEQVGRNLITDGFAKECSDCQSLISNSKGITYNSAYFCNLACFTSYHYREIQEAVNSILREVNKERRNLGEGGATEIARAEEMALIAKMALSKKISFYAAALMVLKKRGEITGSEALRLKKGSLLKKSYAPNIARIANEIVSTYTNQSLPKAKFFSIVKGLSDQWKEVIKYMEDVVLLEISENWVQVLSHEHEGTKLAFGLIEKTYPRQQIVEALMDFILENLNETIPLEDFREDVKRSFGPTYHLLEDFELDEELWDSALEGLKMENKIALQPSISPSHTAMLKKL